MQSFVPGVQQLLTKFMTLKIILGMNPVKNPGLFQLSVMDCDQMLVGWGGGIAVISKHFNDKVVLFKFCRL